MKRPSPAEWKFLVEREPELADLLAEAKSYRKGKGKRFCANEIFLGYGSGKGNSIKTRLYPLVGWEADDDELRTSHAFDVAYDTIYNALPDCRCCGCAGSVYCE